MIIGFDASRAFINNRTGTENYSFQILSNLLQLDHTNKYYIYRRPEEFSQDQALYKTLPFPRLWTQFGLALQTFKDPLDVLFVPAHTLPLIRKPGLKTVVTVHDLGAEFLPGTHQLKQRLYLNLMTHYQLKSATHIIAVSEATKQDLIKKVGIPKDKITVVYEGYNQELYRPIKGNKLSQTLKHYKLEPQNYFLFVGTIQPRKNLERLIRAYAKTNVKALVLAGGKGWLSEDIYKLPKQLGIEDHVKFLGYVPDKDLPALYSGAIAFLFPSLFEGFGLPILEAFSCGCPVLTSNTSSLPEVAGNAALLVDPYSIEEIAQGILSLTINHKLRTRLAKLGLEQVKNFSWQKAAEKTLEVLLFP